MAKLFDFNNPVWRFMGRVADMFFLTVLWFICSIPVITVGASTTALYYAALKMAKNHEGYLWKAFFKSFRENFACSTLIWIIMLAVGMIPGMGFYIIRRMDSQQASFFFWMLAVITILYIFITAMIFPLAARLDAGAGKIIFMAFMVAVKNFSWVLLMTVITFCVIAIGVFVFWPVLLVGAGGTAYAHSVILENIIFPKYNWNEK